MVLSDKDFREVNRTCYKALVKHPILLAKDIVTKAKFLWWLTGIRPQDKVRRTTGTRFFYALRKLLRKVPEYRG